MERNHCLLVSAAGDVDSLTQTAWFPSPTTEPGDTRNTIPNWALAGRLAATWVDSQSHVESKKLMPISISSPFTLVWVPAATLEESTDSTKPFPDASQVFTADTKPLDLHKWHATVFFYNFNNGKNIVDHDPNSIQKVFKKSITALLLRTIPHGNIGGRIHCEISFWTYILNNSLRAFGYPLLQVCVQSYHLKKQSQIEHLCITSLFR